MTLVPGSRAAEIAELIRLEAHPEGGWFRRTHESERRVVRTTGGPDRHALTAIWYLLGPGDVSRWHRVDSDEAWHFCEGAPVDLLSLPPSLSGLRVERLGPLGGESAPMRFVPAGWWQAARPHGDYALVGCSVGPGFEYEDFTLMRDLPEEAGCLSRLHPGLADLL